MLDRQCLVNVTLETRTKFHSNRLDSEISRTPFLKI